MARLLLLSALVASVSAFGAMPAGLSTEYPACTDPWSATSCSDCEYTFVSSLGICTACTMEGMPIETEEVAATLDPPAEFCGAAGICYDYFSASGCEDCPDTYVPAYGICTRCTLEGMPIDTAEEAAALDPPAEFCPARRR